MTSVTSPAQPTERVAFNRLLWAGPLVIVAATLANVILQQIAVAVLQPDPLFLPLTVMPPVIFTIVGMLGAVIVYTLVGRFSRRPVWLFQRIALITLLISFIPDILMLITGFNPGTTVANVVVIMLMHVVAWLISVRLLTKLTQM